DAPLRASARDCTKAANRAARARGPSRTTGGAQARTRAAGQVRDSNPVEIAVEHHILPAEVVLLRADGRLEETGRLGHGPVLATPERQIREPYQVDHQGGGEDRIASLPGGLLLQGARRHAGAGPRPAVCDARPLSPSLSHRGPSRRHARCPVTARWPAPLCLLL